MLVGEGFEGGLGGRAKVFFFSVLDAVETGGYIISGM
jgi:hypothetical protein